MLEIKYFSLRIWIVFPILSLFPDSYFIPGSFQCNASSCLAQTARHLSRLLRNGPNWRRHQTTVGSSSGLDWLGAVVPRECVPCNKHNNTKWLLMHAKAKHSGQWQKLSAYEDYNYPLHDLPSAVAWANFPFSQDDSLSSPTGGYSRAPLYGSFPKWSAAAVSSGSSSSNGTWTRPI